MYSKLCGDTTLKNVVLVTNMWTTVSLRDGEAFEKELLGNAFKLALARGAHMVRHNGTPKSAHDIIREITKNNPPIRWGVVDKHKGTIDTTTGEAISPELDEETGPHQDIMQPLKGKLEEGGRRLHEWIDDIKKHLGDQEVRMEREVKERERIEAEYKQKLADLNLRLQRAETASAADRTRLEQAKAEHSRQLAELNHHLQEAANASANDRAKMDHLVKEREWVDAEHKHQLADLTRHLQNETSASAAHRVVLEQEIKELRGRVAAAVTVPPRIPPRPTPCVQIRLYSAAHDG